MFLGSMHPVHVSVMNMEYIEDEKSFSISIKTFKDDMEIAIYHRYGKIVNLSEIGQRATGNAFIEKYLLETIEIKYDENIIAPTIEEIIYNDDGIHVKLKSKANNNLDKISVLNTLLMDIYMDQTNLVIISYKNKEKGYKLDVKNNSFEITF
jgi:hypothetical protein